MKDTFAIFNCFETQDLKLRFLTKEDIPLCLAFQDENTTSDVYVKITEDEFLESVEKDDVIAAYFKKEFVGFCLLIKNRKTRRSLAPDINADFLETATFDAVVVSQKFRGHALQKIFIKIACEIAKNYNPKPCFMAATVSPYNIYSKRNFLESGFEIKDQKEKYGGNLRLIVSKDI